MQMQSRSPARRDRAREIGLAIDALVTGTGPVQLGSGPAQGRVVFSDRPAERSHSRWLPFTGEAGQLLADGDTLLVGIAQPAGGDGLTEPERVRSAAESAVGQAVPARWSDGPVALTFDCGPPGGPALDQVGARTDGIVTAAIDGLAIGLHATEPLRIVLDDPAWQPAAERGLLAADVVRLARLLVSAPANLLTPERAAGWARRIADSAGLDCVIREPARLAADGFGALLAVGAGSPNGPRLVTLERRGRPGQPTIALVGKGVTFDSGGLSLKSPASMQSMRMDVAGAVTVLAVMAALPRLDPAVGVRAVLPFAENLPGPGAVRPGDEVSAWDGTTIQVLDTDFEGRVILADALSFAASSGPDLIVDLATLTYQAEIALGQDIAAVLGRDDSAVGRWLEASVRAGEPMWRLPWAERYLHQVRTSDGVRNHPLHDVGRALTAALFLGEFVPVGQPWVHCDFAGPAWRGDTSADGGTGFGARTLLELLRAEAIG